MVSGLKGAKVINALDVYNFKICTIKLNCFLKNAFSCSDFIYCQKLD